MYDSGTRPERYLPAYACEFSSVEVDSTWYGTPPSVFVRPRRGSSAYANNHYAGHSPAVVRAFYKVLGVEYVEPSRIEQTALF